MAIPFTRPDLIYKLVYMQSQTRKPGRPAGRTATREKLLDAAVTLMRQSGLSGAGINEIVREAELEDARKAAQSISKGSISKAIEKVVDPTGEMRSTVTGVEKDLKDTKQISPVGPIPPSPTIAATPPASPAIAAPEPAKDTEAPGDAASKAEAKV
jgi:hypothetical protein